VKAAEAEGVPFALNARTDAFLRAGDRDPEAVLGDAIERGRAFVDAGATCVFVPGKLDTDTVRRLVDGIGRQKISIIAVPGSLTQAELAGLGVARISFGPWSLRVALTAWADTATELLRGASQPAGVRPI
jgi:2-methylisocitrate lyase-like PEP mutase family enzyme